MNSLQLKEFVAGIEPSGQSSFRPSFVTPLNEVLNFNRDWSVTTSDSIVSSSDITPIYFVCMSLNDTLTDNSMAILVFTVTKDISL